MKHGHFSIQLFAALVAFVASSRASAHDLWLIPPKKIEPNYGGNIDAGTSGFELEES